MISINRIVLLQIFLVLFLSSFHKVKGGLFVRNRVYVELFNDLGLNVTVHCKSGHNDLGSHFIQYPNGFYQFNFKPNTFGTSDYYCNFQWPNNFHWFDIYLFDRDHPQCSKCFWKIRPDGVCKLNYETKQYDLCYPWNPDKLDAPPSFSWSMFPLLLWEARFKMMCLLNPFLCQKSNKGKTIFLYC